MNPSLNPSFLANKKYHRNDKEHVWYHFQSIFFKVLKSLQCHQRHIKEAMNFSSLSPALTLIASKSFNLAHKKKQLDVQAEKGVGGWVGPCLAGVCRSQETRCVFCQRKVSLDWSIRACSPQGIAAGNWPLA